MYRLLNKANRVLSVSWAAGLLASATLIANLLGLLRERLLLANFGVGAELDAYKAAFTIPDFMYFILTSGALSVTFIPVFNERLLKGNKKSAWALSTSLLNFMAVITLAASVLIMIFASPLVHIVASGLDDTQTAQAANMMRLIAVNPFLFSISAVFTSMQQAVGRFVFFALAPSFYSIGIILGTIYLSPYFGIEGVAYGVVIGSIFQLIISAMGLFGMGYRYTPRISWKHKGFREVLGLLPARSVDQGIDYFNNIVEVNIASRLGAGAITAYQTAFTLHSVPISLIGMAIGTAVFPRLSERINQGRSDLFKKELLSILRIVVWLALPTSVIAYLGRGYLVRLLAAGGNPVIASLLGLLAVSIFFRSIFHIMSRSFYAQHDTKTPLYISIFAIILNIILAVWMAQPENYGLNGLALAQSIVAVAEVSLLIFFLWRRYPGFITPEFSSALVKMISAVGLMSVLTYILIRIFPLGAKDRGFSSLVPKFSIVVVISLSWYIAISKLFGLKEADPIVKRVSSVLFAQIDFKKK